MYLLIVGSHCCVIRDDVKLAQLVRARDCQSRGRRFDSGKNKKTENSNLHRFEVHRPSSKGTKLLFQVIKAIINQCEHDSERNIREREMERFFYEDTS